MSHETNTWSWLIADAWLNLCTILKKCFFDTSNGNLQANELPSQFSNLLHDKLYADWFDGTISMRVDSSSINWLTFDRSNQIQSETEYLQTHTKMNKNWMVSYWSIPSQSEACIVVVSQRVSGLTEKLSIASKMHQRMHTTSSVVINKFLSQCI